MKQSLRSRWKKVFFIYKKKGFQKIEIVSLNKKPSYSFGVARQAKEKFFKILMLKVFELITKASKETTEAVKNSAEAIELKWEETARAVHETEVATKSVQDIFEKRPSIW